MANVLKRVHNALKKKVRKEEGQEHPVMAALKGELTVEDLIAIMDGRTRGRGADKGSSERPTI